MAYKKVQTVPSLMIDYQSASFFQCLPPEEKEILWNSIMDYVDIARERNAENVQPSLPEGLSKIAYKTFDGMINSIDNGFEAYWKICDKNAERIRKRWAKQQEEKQKDTTVYHGNTEEYRNDTSRLDTDTNSVNSISPAMQKIIDSDRQQEYLSIINIFMRYKFNMTYTLYDGIARKMLYEDLDEESVRVCMEVCKQKGIYTEDYFFRVYNNKLQWAQV